MHSAWNSLFYYDPEPDQAKLEMFMDVGDIELPLVWTHKSGRKSLVLGCTAQQHCRHGLQAERAAAQWPARMGDQ